MGNFNGFGQLTAIFSAANDAQLMAANAILADRKRKGEQKLQESALRQSGDLQKLDLSFREKELAARIATSKRRDNLFKDMALYAGIGLTTVVVLITVGVMFVNTKRESQYEYLIEEDS